MNQNSREFCLEVWGDYACFTRPELKVERVSYDVITPSAARMIFSGIFWKPAIRWEVTKIEVLNPIRWASIKRNEVGGLLSKNPIYCDDPSRRIQRNTLLLKNVRYRIYANQIFIPLQERKHDEKLIAIKSAQKKDYEALGKLVWDETPLKYQQIFINRARKGQFKMPPYLGQREFALYFRLVSPDEERMRQPIHETRDLGIMVYDRDYTKPNAPAMFFHARMENGVIIVPPVNSKEVLK